MLVVIHRYKPELNRQLSSMVMTVGGHWELRVAALLKTQLKIHQSQPNVYTLF